MLGSVFAKSLRDLRRSFVGWSLGLAGYVGLIVAVYPTIRDNPDLNKLVESYPEALKAFIAFGGQADFTSAAGYLGSELFAFMIPALFLVASVGNGAGAIAGEEERGTLDLLLSFPRSRTRIAVEKLAAMCAEVVGLGAGALARAVDRCADLRDARLGRPPRLRGGRPRRAGDSLRRDRVHARGGNGAEDARRRSHRGARRGRVPRQLARGARRRARAVPEALALLPLRRRRPAPPAASTRGTRSSSSGWAR